MAVKIGWSPWPEKIPVTTQSSSLYWGNSEILTIAPKRLDTWEGKTNGFVKCPAFSTYVSSTYMICASIDIDLTWDHLNKVLITNLPYPSQSTYVNLHMNDFDHEKDPPIVAMMTSMLFVADKPTMIELIPPYNHIDPSWRIMPGSFNIYNWFRPVIATFEMLDNHVSIKRGQPLMYVRFKTENFKDNFVLERIERTAELDHLVNSCLSVKSYQPGLSWKIANSFNPIRPKSLLKNNFLKRFLEKK